MHITSLRLSNILSFPYVNNIDDAVEIRFDKTLNILIGGNGSGKSTALEAINFVFKKVLFRSYGFNQSNFEDPSPGRRSEAFQQDSESTSYRDIFRLDPNWDTENSPQIIQLEVRLDEIDKANIETIISHYSTIAGLVNSYSTANIPTFSQVENNQLFRVTITLDRQNDTYAIEKSDLREDIAFYLSDYELLREIISLHNGTVRESEIIPQLSETFSMLSAFRNYHSFSKEITLSQEPQEQLRRITKSTLREGVSAPGSNEPSIFKIVALKLAAYHYDITEGRQSDDDGILKANNLDLTKNINMKLSIINLQFRIRLVSRRSWQYSFEFVDSKRNKLLGSIQRLSAGQRSIVHLVFEAYGRGDMKGGVVIIDEPEIHLHYQFQYEYLRIIREIIEEQGVQFILVTHSDGFISHDTAQYVKRFSLDNERHSSIHRPTNTADLKKMVQILENTQSARALFGNKVVLVEGPTDRYFFRSLLAKLHPELSQEISIYDTGGKNTNWRPFFEGFGLAVYEIKDLDAAFEYIYNRKDGKYTLKPSTNIERFRNEHPTIDGDIEAKYAQKLYILKKGAIETYTTVSANKDLYRMIVYCTNIDQFINRDDELSKEILFIMEKIVSD